VLNKSLLRSKLEHHFASPTDFNTAGSRIAEAYYSYASGAQSCAGTINLASLVGRQASLRAIVTAAISTGRGPATISRIAKAIGAFWLIPGPVTFLGPSPGAITVVVPQVLEAMLLAITTIHTAVGASGKSLPSSRVAQQWTDAIDTWTRTIVAAHVLPSVCVGPLT
jgi:hypothetical protein